MTMSTIGTASGFTADTGPAFDDLLGGEYPRVPGSGTVLSGSGVVLRGSLLGKITAGATTATAAAKAGGNTGNGTLTMDATTPTLAGVKVGVYTVTCTAAATDSGTFRVTDPDGYVLGDVAVGATFQNDVKFVIADGSADFIVGDGFTVTVATAAGSAKYKLSLAAATDGSQTPVAILATQVDATSADVTNAPMYFTGEFNERQVTFGTGHTAASVKEALKDRGIFLQNTVPAAATS